MSWLFGLIAACFGLRYQDPESCDCGEAGGRQHRPCEHTALLAELKAELVNRERQIDSLQRDLRDVHRGEDFVLVLIDGDGCIPTPELLLDGRAGGEAAATALRNAVVKEAAEAGVKADVVVVHYVCNLLGLRRVLNQAEELPLSKFDAFLAGFASASPLFTWTDAGQHSEAADEVIRAYLRLLAPLRHCLRIYLGGSHDSGYVLDVAWLEARNLGHKLRMVGTQNSAPRSIIKAIAPQSLLIIPGLFRRHHNLPRRKRASLSATEPTQTGVAAPPRALPTPYAPMSAMRGAPISANRTAPIWATRAAPISPTPKAPISATPKAPISPGRPRGAVKLENPGWLVGFLPTGPRSNPSAQICQTRAPGLATLARPPISNPSPSQHPWYRREAAPIKDASPSHPSSHRRDEAPVSDPCPSQALSYRRNGPLGHTVPVRDPAALASLTQRPCNQFYLEENGCPHPAHCAFSHAYHFSAAALQALRQSSKARACTVQKKTGTCEDKACFRAHRCPAGAKCPKTCKTCQFGKLRGAHPPGAEWDKLCDRDNKDVQTNGDMGYLHCLGQPYDVVAFGPAAALSSTVEPQSTANARTVVYL